MPGFNIGSSGQGSEEQPGSTFELHRVHRWKIHQLIAGGSQSLLTSDDLLYAKSITLPAFNVEEESVRGGSIAYKFAKGINWDDVTVVFYDVFDLLPNIEKMRQTVWTPEEGLKVANNYKGDSEFWLLNGYGDAVRKFILRNSWVKAISHSELTYTNSDIKEVTLTISYDWAEEDVGDKPGQYTFKDDVPEGSVPYKKDTQRGWPQPRFGDVPDNLDDLRRDGESKPKNPAKERAAQEKAERDAKRKALENSKTKRDGELAALAIDPKSLSRP